MQWVKIEQYIFMPVADRVVLKTGLILSKKYIS